jgi:hypothetical protein
MKNRKLIKILQLIVQNPVDLNVFCVLCNQSLSVLVLYSERL